MLTLQSAKERLQIDSLISNLRWVLLLSVALVSYVQSRTQNEAFLELPQIILLTFALFYNITVVLAISYGGLSRSLPVLTLLVDTALTIGFVIASGGLRSPLLFFTLFPILTAALRFRWVVSLLIGVVTVLGCGLVGYAFAPRGTAESELLPFAGSSLVLLFAALISGLIGDKVKQRLARGRRLAEEAELRKLRAAQEHSRAIFELASTLSATLNYNKVLEGVLEVGEAGMRDLGRSNAAHISMVLLFSHNDLRIVASRHLPPRDQKTTFQGKDGILAHALTSAETMVSDDPTADPELSQLIAMHGCKQAIVVPLRAGFESFGVVVFGSPQPNTYTQDHQDLLRAICDQAIVALQNAQLYQSLTEEKERIVQVEEDARKKLSRDLHDGPTQSIAAIAMRLNYTRMLLQREKNIAQTATELEKIEELARRTTKEIRHMLFTLRPLILESQGLQAAIEQHIAKLAETDSLAIHMEAQPGVDQVLDKNAQGVIFYILDEAIGNARKHGESKIQNIWVRLHVKDNAFIAQVEDDGPGFDVEAVQVSYDQRGSLGLINMHERAELVNGKLSIASAEGQGTRITLVVPLRGR